MHSRMRNGQFFCLENKVVIEYDVNVDASVCITAVLAFVCPSQSLFNDFGMMQYVGRRKGGLYDDGDIDEEVVGTKTDRCCLIKRRTLDETPYGLAKCCDGFLDIIFPVA